MVHLEVAAGSVAVLLLPLAVQAALARNGTPLMGLARVAAVAAGQPTESVRRRPMEAREGFTAVAVARVAVLKAAALSTVTAPTAHRASSSSHTQPAPPMS